MGLKKGLMIICFIFIISFISAGPYGYGDSMKLHKEIIDGNVIYGYGNQTTQYITTLTQRESIILNNTNKTNVSFEMANAFEINSTSFKLRREIFTEELANKIFSTYVNPFEIKQAKEEQEREKLSLLSNKRSQLILDEFNKNLTWVTIKASVISKDVRDDVLSSLSDEEFKLEYESTLGLSFAGEITRQGLDKLMNNTAVNSLNLGGGSSSTLLSLSVPHIEVRPYVWNLGYSGEGQTVCVIDSGVNSTHPDLTGKILAEKCYCRNPEGANQYCCPNGDYVDDDAEDYTGHGTHVSGIIVSQDSVYTGVAPNASIVVVKVCNSSTTNNCNDYDIADGIAWCVNNKDTYNISVITISIGGGIYTPGSCIENYADNEINSAIQEGIFIDAASGNAGSSEGIAYPACNSNVTSVGASWKSSDKLWNSTNRASNLDLLAPGYLIQSTDYHDPLLPKVMSGTSMAAPHVAGAVALLLERDPTLTPYEIKNNLSTEGIVNIWDSASQRFYPRINVSAAIDALCVTGDWSAGSCGGGTCSGTMRQYTRTTSPSGCADESDCQYDETCIEGDTLTVCSSGCDYTTVQDAIDNSDTQDLIKITDQGTYDSEDLNWSTGAENVILNCQGATITDSGYALHIPDKDGIVIMNCIFNSSTGILITGTQGHYEIYNNVFDVEEKAIYLNLGVEGGHYIEDNLFLNADEMGIYYKGSSSSYGDPGNSLIKNNDFLNNNWAIYLKYSQWNTISYNLFEANARGIYFYSSNDGYENTITNNNITDGDYGIYIQDQSDTTISNNSFCKENSIYDFYVSPIEGNSGSDNKCEKPYTWDDDGATGCTSFCNVPATTELIYPLNNSIYEEENITLVCSSQEDVNLANVTLYHDLSGTWQSNQTKDISGYTNITQFEINNLPNATSFSWSCFVYDNVTRGGFAEENWTTQIILPLSYYPPVMNYMLPLNNKLDKDGQVNFVCGYDDDAENVTVSLYGNFNGTYGIYDSQNLTASNGGAQFNATLEDGTYTWSCEITDLRNQSKFFTRNHTLIVNTTMPLLSLENPPGNAVVWFDAFGNLSLLGTCSFSSNCTAPEDSLIIENSNNETVAYISLAGNLCLETDTCDNVNQANCNPSTEGVILQNDLGANLSYIDFNGNLCLTGNLNENA